MRLGRLVLLTLGAIAAAGLAQAVDPEPRRSEDAAASAGSASPENEQIASLIRQLGDSSYQVRERATRAIARLGLAAKPALVAALKHFDPEVRLRARHALGDILAADYQARLAAFIADKGENGGEAALPLWRRFRQVIGGDKSARQLFIEMHKAEGGLLETAQSGGQATADALLIRCQQIRHLQSFPNPKMRAQPTAASLCAVVFVASDPRVRFPDATMSLVYSFVNHAAFQAAMRSGAQVSPVRKIVGAWIARTSDTRLVYQNLRLAMRYDIKEALEPALRVAADRTQSTNNRLYAVLAVGKLGDKSHVPRIEALLGDTATLAQITRIVNGKRVSEPIQARDVALAVMIHLTGQDTRQYGYKNSRKNSQLLFVPNTLSLQTEENRKAALAKWRAWRAANPIAEPPVEAPDPAGADDVPSDDPAASREKAAADPNGAAFNQKGAQNGAVQRLGGLMRALAGAGGAANASPNQELGSDDFPFRLAERSARQRISRGRQLIAGGQFAEASQVLGPVLTQSSGGSYQPDRGQPIYRDVKNAAERLIGSMPPEGRAQYELQFGFQARRKLAAAVASGDAKSLETVARGYFHTKAGGEAALLWANHQLDAGRPLEAALELSRLRDGSLEPRLRPLLLLKLAVASGRAGLTEESLAALRELREELRGGNIQLGGKRVETPSGAAASLAWLRSALGAEDSLEAAAPGDWLLFRGDRSRNGVAKGAMPFLRSQWRFATLAPQGTKGRDIENAVPIQETVDRLRRQYRETHVAVMPVAQPLAVDGLVVTRTPNEMLALEVDSGETRWRVQFDDSATTLAIGQDLHPPKLGAEHLAQGLDERLWSDWTYGLISSDGQRVFGVEDVGFAYGLLSQRMVVTPDGSRRLNPGWPSDFNRLTAYDVHSGKLRWEVGGPRGADPPLAGAFFLGCGLPLGGRLYVVAEIDDQVRLLTLEAHTGALLEDQLLEQIQHDPFEAQRRAVMRSAPRRPKRRMAGVSPSYQGGVLICPTATESFVAIDLATGRKLWSYRGAEAQTSEPPWNPMMRFFGMAAAEPPEFRDAHWVDQSATISEDRVLLTPRRGAELVCLSLDGELLWSVPRLDSLYVACVHQGIVLLVGRGTLRGLRLDDGQAAWPSLKLPPAAAPSGRGYLSDGRYYLPLSTAEVDVIDVAGGRLVGRSRSPTGRVPGNLLCCQNRVISQGVDSIEAFHQLPLALERFAAELTARPDDPGVLASHGESLMLAGDFSKALEQLGRSYELRPSQETGSLIRDAVLQSLASDFAGHRPLAEKFKSFFERPQDEARYLRAMGEGMQAAGKPLAAFEAYLQLADLTWSDMADHASVEAVETALEVRRDRWLRSRFTSLRDASSPPRREEMDRRLAARLDEALAKEPQKRLPRFLAHFPKHPLADKAREALALQPPRREALLRRELLLLELAESPDAKHRRAATASLAQLLAGARRPHEAAVLYARLNGPLARQVCLEGKTGADLFNALPKDSTVRAILGDVSPWPKGQVERKTITSRRATADSYLKLQIDEARHDLFDRLSLEVVSTGRAVRAVDGGRNPQWKVDLPTIDSSMRSINASIMRARLYGHLLVLWRGDRIFGIDTLAAGGAAVLWSKELAPKLQTGVFRAAQPRVMFLPFFGRVIQATDAFGRPIGKLGPVRNQWVCFQRARSLEAIEPLTGKTLWVRHDVDPGSRIFGDDETLLVVPPRKNEARVFRSSDGVEIGIRKLPEEDDVVGYDGRHMLVWSAENDKMSLRLFDPFERRDVWRREFTAGAKMGRAGLRDVGILEPGGKFVLLSPQDGRDIFSSRLEEEPYLSDLVVLPNQGGCLIIASGTPEGASQVTPILRTINPPSLVNGIVYGLDAKGRRIWSTRVKNQCLLMDQAEALPVLTFACRLRTVEKNGRSRTSSAVLCLDKRNGRVIHQGAIAGAISRVQIVPDQKNHTIDIRTTRDSTLLTFTDKPLPPKKPPAEEPASKPAEKK